MEKIDNIKKNLIKKLNQLRSQPLLNKNLLLLLILNFQTILL
jgi:hypothetical protein